MSAPFSGKAVGIGRSSGPPGRGSLTIASANAGGEASTRVAARPSRESGAGTRESEKGVPAPWPYLQPDSDLVRMHLYGVLRNVHLPAAVAVNGAESFVAAGGLGLRLIQGRRYHVESDLE